MGKVNPQGTVYKLWCLCNRSKNNTEVGWTISDESYSLTTSNLFLTDISLLLDQFLFDSTFDP